METSRDGCKARFPVCIPFATFDWVSPSGKSWQSLVSVPGWRHTGGIPRLYKEMHRPHLK